jgi:probable HAF family extracellular repeat protein
MKKSHGLRLAIAFGISIALIPSWATPAKAQRTYTVTDLGSVPGAFQTSPSDINNRGEILLTSFLSFFPVFETVGFVSKDGKMIFLPTFGGQFSLPSAINDSGVVAGSANFVGDTITHAAIWNSDFVHITDLGTLGGPTSAANGINNRREVAGGSVVSNGTDTHAFLWTGGKMSDLGTLGGRMSFAFAINDSSLVVGQSDTTTTLDPMLGIPPFHGFRWQRDVMSDLGEIFGGHFNYGQDVNNRGEIVGAADLAGDLTGHAFMIQGGSLTDLGTVAGDTNSAAFGVNNRGQVVGTSAQAVSIPALPPVQNWICPCHAVIWEDGNVTDLNTRIPPGTGWQLSFALAINDLGQIVGFGTLNNGFAVSAFLLTPQEGNSPFSTTSAAQAKSTAAPSQASPAGPAGIQVRIIDGRPGIVVQR